MYFPKIKETNCTIRKFSGIGEQGKPAKLPDGYDKLQYDSLYQQNGYNALLSDYISLNRSVPDIRHKE